MTQTFVLGVFVLVAAATGEPEIVRIVDESGAPVDHCEAMWHTENEGYARFEKVQGGRWRSSISNRVSCADVIVRSAGFATTVERFDRVALKELANEGATITLRRGRQVKILLELPDGVHVPADALLHNYVPQFQPRVRSSWPPYNARGSTSDWNLLNATKVDDDEYTLQLTDKTGEFWLAFHHPGWLQFCELGPFTEQDIEKDTLRVKIPRPAKVDVVFRADAIPQEQWPFESATLEVWYAPGGSGLIYGVTDHEFEIRAGEHRSFSDLGPGPYYVQVRTKPKSSVQALAETNDINPGRFFDREQFDLSSGDSRSIEFDWAPFDPESYRGDARAEITIQNPDGSAPSGQEATISWWDGHYGGIVVHRGAIPDNGVLKVDGISARQHRASAKFGPFTVAVGDKRLGFFALDQTADVQKFEFTVTPAVGDLAPDVDLIDVATGHKSRLSDYRGKVVCLEFWGIGCGPCQPAMNELNEFAAAKLPEWEDKLVVVSVSTDRDADAVRRHAAGAGWTAFPHHLGVRNGDEYFSKAETEFVILGIPEAFVLDRTGRIAWRGHPASDEFHKVIETLASQ